MIGVASANWLAESADVVGKEIIDNARENVTFALNNLTNITPSGKSVLSDLKPE